MTRLLRRHEHPLNDGSGQSQGWKIKWAQLIGPAECPMMVRWVLECPWFRPALHRHAVDTAGCWTLVLRGTYQDIAVTGPISRRWGFWDAGLFRPVADYFRRYGYAACE